VPQRRPASKKSQKDRGGKRDTKRAEGGVVGRGGGRKGKKKSVVVVCVPPCEKTGGGKPKKNQDQGDTRKQRGCNEKREGKSGKIKKGNNSGDAGGRGGKRIGTEKSGVARVFFNTGNNCFEKFQEGKCKNSVGEITSVEWGPGKEKFPNGKK